MIRILNISLIVVTGLICLGVYRVAEEARIAALQLREARAAIAEENRSLTVLGAEWATLTQPQRIQRLAERHLNLTDRPTAQVASVGQLPQKFLPQTEPAIRNANAVVSQAPDAPRASAPTHAGT